MKNYILNLQRGHLCSFKEWKGGFVDLDRQRQSCLFVVGLELNLSGSVNGPFVVT